jgi:hypothetical protein
MHRDPHESAAHHGGCCEPQWGDGHGMHPHGHHAGHGCCCGHHGIARHFVTKAERLEALESYRDSLQKELEGLNEHIQELEK